MSINVRKIRTCNTAADCCTGCEVTCLFMVCCCVTVELNFVLFSVDASDAALCTAFDSKFLCSRCALGFFFVPFGLG